MKDKEKIYLSQIKSKISMHHLITMVDFSRTWAYFVLMKNSITQRITSLETSRELMKNDLE